MNKNEIKKMEKFNNLALTSFSEIYDEQYCALSLSNINKSKQEYADKILQQTADALEKKGILGSLKSKDVEYVADMSDSLKKAVERGEVKLDVSKDGTLYAQLRNAGKYGKKIPIKKVVKDNGIDPLQLSTALQLKSIERQLENVITELDSIGESVSEVKQGQQNDRLGLLYSGMNMYLEAQSLQNTELKQYMIVQSIKSISDANTQIMQQLQSDITYLVTQQYKKKKGTSYDEIQSRMKNINRCFDLIYNSAMIKAAIYLDQNELLSMLTALQEYGRFIQKAIIPVTPMLIELDDNEEVIKQDIWHKRAESIEMIENVKEMIESHNQSYLLKLTDHEGLPGQKELAVKGVSYAR